MSKAEDLGITIGTPTEVKWNEVLKIQEESLIANKINATIAQSVIDLAKRMIEEEKETFK